MELSAKLSSKGQLTVPKQVRQALRLEEGDAVVFRVDGERAVLARTPRLLDLAGSVRVPGAQRGTSCAAQRGALAPHARRDGVRRHERPDPPPEPVTLPLPEPDASLTTGTSRRNAGT